jgi:hypothetical protein
MAHDRQQGLVLLRGQADSRRRRLAERQEAAQFVAERRYRGELITRESPVKCRITMYMRRAF